MEKRDLENIKKSWPVYLLLVLLLLTVVWYYRENPRSGGNIPLSKAISRNIDPSGLKRIVNLRKGWEPVMGEWWGEKASDFGFKDMEDQTRKISDFSGKGLIILFWGSYSKECFDAMGEIRSVQNDRGAEEFSVIAITSEEASEIKAIVDTLGFEFVFVAGRRILPEPFGEISKVPTTIFVDKEGKMQVLAVGVVPDEQIREILEAIERLE